MALRVDYVVKETGTNLRRNVTLTIATVVTIALTLTAVGAFFLAKKGIDRANVKFKNNVSFIVFMNADAQQAQIDSVGRLLSTTPQVKSTRYLNHDDALTEFKQVFADRPELYRNLAATDLPTSYKVFLADGSSDVVLSLVSQFQKEPGVLEVAAPSKAIKEQEDAFATMRRILFAVALIVGGASLVLIINSIRVAMFARRREIEVMKLVGATNWFIRVPFMFEGMLEGVVGSIAAVGAMWSLKVYLLPPLVRAGGTFSGFRLESSDLFSASIWVLLAGAAIGVGASFIAATRYLDV